MEGTAITNMLYQEFKYWSTAATAFWAVFKGFTWVKEIRTNDLYHLQSSVNEVKAELKTQTASIVDSMATNTNEIKELRTDIKTLTTAFIAPPMAKAARARRKKK